MNRSATGLTGRRVFFYFLAFFLLIAAVNAVMVALAIRTHSGLITDHPYEKGLAYNKVVVAEEAQEKLGWSGLIELRHPREGGNPFAIYFELKDKSGAIIHPEKTTATISRPTQDGMDFAIELGAAETPVKFPAKGVWEVRVDAVVGDKNYQQSKRIVVE